MINSMVITYCFYNIMDAMSAKHIVHDQALSIFIFNHY